MAQISAALVAEHSIWGEAGEASLPAQTARSLSIAREMKWTRSKRIAAAPGHRRSNREHQSNRGAGTHGSLTEPARTTYRKEHT
jgi:hypothetical protein